MRVALNQHLRSCALPSYGFTHCYAVYVRATAVRHSWTSTSHGLLSYVSVLRHVERSLHTHAKRARFTAHATRLDRLDVHTYRSAEAADGTSLGTVAAWGI